MHSAVELIGQKGGNEQKTEVDYRIRRIVTN